MSALDLDVLRAAHSDLNVQVSSSPTSDPDSHEVRISVPGEHVRALLERLRGEAGTQSVRLLDLTVVDRLDASPAGFEVVYRLASRVGEFAYRVHGFIPDSAEDNPSIDSVSALWPSALWLEREAFDLFGIGFRGHPELRRLLLGADFGADFGAVFDAVFDADVELNGAPLRKSAGHGQSSSGAGR